ncbi:hypothetical protein BGZ88_000181 [Linnemannia elongata]|nr:hypothetical protein BGZ88_000181 [Linnemannia elongata]
MIGASSSFSRAGRKVLTSNSRHLCTVLHNARSTTARIPSATTNKTLTAATASSTSRSWYTTTPILFRKFESHHDHANIHNPSPSSSTKSAAASAASASGSQEQEDDGEIPPKDSVNKALLTDADDLMVGNEGLETIDPKDFPELYPHDHEIEGLSQESHPDNERDFEGFQEGEDVEVQEMEEGRRSVLLSDKPRSEDEFSWFVDESYPDKATTGQEEEFVPLWQKNVQRSPDGGAMDESSGGAGEPEYTPDSIPGLVKLLESERAKNIKLKKTSPSTSPPVMEGRDTSDWVVIDAGSVVIHFMTPEARKERDLEGLWASVKNPLKMKDVEEISWEDVKGKMTKSWKEDHGRSKGEDGKRGRRGERDIPLSDVVKW